MIDASYFDEVCKICDIIASRLKCFVVIAIYGLIINKIIFRTMNFIHFRKLVLVFFTFTISFFLISNSSCKSEDYSDIDFRKEMRNFVISISDYSKNKNPRFFVIPQNGLELITNNGEKDGAVELDYLNAIEGIGCEDLFYGYYGDDLATPDDERNYLIGFCNLFESHSISVLVTDYCITQTKVDSSFYLCNQNKFISFPAPERELNVIPIYPDKPYNENSQTINSIYEAKNFLYLINSEKYSSKSDFIDAVCSTNYDIVIIDLFHNGEELSKEEINKMKEKNNKADRLVISYLSIGEAEEYRYYWKEGWRMKKPSWLEKENPEWKGNYKVEYWDKEWQSIIFGNTDSYLDKIIAAGFDGVYLDIIDAFEYFEN